MDFARFTWCGIRQSAFAAFAALALTFGWSNDSIAEQAKTFETPQAAAQAMAEARGNDGLGAIVDLLGSDFEAKLKGGDEAAAEPPHPRA